jgi:hypothetical protein
MAAGDRVHVRRLDVHRLGLEGERDEGSSRVAGDEVRRIAVERLRKARGTESLPGEADPPVTHDRAGIDVERPDARVHDPFRAGGAAGERQLAPVGEVVVDPAIEFRLARATVGERGIGRARTGRTGNVAGRA